MENILKKGSYWRNEESKEIRRVRKLLQGQEQENATSVSKSKFSIWVGAFGISLLMWAALFIAGCFVSNPAHAMETYTDEEIVNAIYKAEGGSKAQYKYGIRSVRYSNETEARKICFNTVRNNRKRFAKYGHRQYSSFIQFLGSRYCPTKGGNLTASEKRLNGNWEKNVRLFLAKEVR